MPSALQAAVEGVDLPVTGRFLAACLLLVVAGTALGWFLPALLFFEGLSSYDRSLLTALGATVFCGALPAVAIQAFIVRRTGRVTLAKRWGRIVFAAWLVGAVLGLPLGGYQLAFMSGPVGGALAALCLLAAYLAGRHKT